VVRSQPSPTEACAGAPADACTSQGPEQAVANRAPGASDVANVQNAPNAPGPHGRVVALAPRRYKFEITVDQQTHDKLRTLQDLLGHQLPSADPAIIVCRAIDRLLDETLKKKAAVTDRARPSDRGSEQRNDRRRDRRTRAIPAAIRREVWQRDGGRCTFVDQQGRRCRGTRAMEYHHERPYGKGGQHGAGNIALRCRAHNRYQADLDFGSEFMRDKRHGNSSPSARNV
jgi:5-methylcytosine-specific restriction endonuclease McrA